MEQANLFEEPQAAYNTFGIPPEVYRMFIQYALDLKRTGIDRYSARAIIHRIRWHMHVERGVREFKCNNNWTPRMARWAMSDYPELRGMFELRITNDERESADE